MGLTNIPESDSNRSFQNENSNVNPDAVSKCSFPMENSNKDNKNNEVATTFSEKAKVDISSWNCEICDYRCKNETSLNAHMSRKHPTIQQLDGNSSLGATSIEKIPKISASGRNYFDPLPHSLKKGSTDENVGISYLIVIVKFVFFKISTPPLPYF